MGELDTRIAVMLSVVFVAAFTAILVVLVWVRHRMSREQDREQERGDEPFWRRISKAFEPAVRRKEEIRAHDGTQYRYVVQPGGKNTPPSLTVEIESKSHGHFEVRKETAFDRFFKRLGVACELQIGDPAFDEEYYIHTDTPDFTRVYFGDFRRLRSVREILGAGFTSVKHDGQTLAAIIRPLQREPDEDHVSRVVGNLAGMAKNLPASPQFGGLGTENWKRKRILVVVLSLGVYLAGMTCLGLGLVKYPPLDGLQLFLHSLQYSLPALALYLFSSLVLLRGRSGSHKEWVVAAAIAVAGLPLSGWGFEVFANGYFDLSEARSHNVLVSDKFTRNTKEGVEYHVVVESWREPGAGERFGVSRAEFWLVEPGRTRMTVTTRAGRLGFEWLVGYDWA